MAAAPAQGWFKGIVKSVTSGDTLLITSMNKEIDKDKTPLEKLIRLSSIQAPKVANKDTVDEPFAWESRLFLTNKCIGKEITFRIDYFVPAIKREFATVFVGDTNVAVAILGSGLAKVRSGSEKSPFFQDLLKAQEQAEEKRIGVWSEGPVEGSVRSLPPSAFSEGSAFDAQAFVEANKGKELRAFVESARDGSSLRLFLLPGFQYVQVLLAGVQSPKCPRLPQQHKPPSPASDGEDMTAAQKLAAASSASERAAVPGEEWGVNAKHFTEMRVLNREVRLSLVTTDRYNNLYGNVTFIVDEKPVDLAVELVQEGLAKCSPSLTVLDEARSSKLRSAELKAKTEKLRIFEKYAAPPPSANSNLKETFTGTVVEVVSSDCIVVADDSKPLASPGSERRLLFSSVQPHKDRTSPLAIAGKDFLRSQIIGKPVHVTIEYKWSQPNAPTRVNEVGSVILLTKSKAAAAAAAASGQPQGIIVAELVVANGFNAVAKFRDFSERSMHFDALVAAEKKAQTAKKGMYSASVQTVANFNDLSTQPHSVFSKYTPFLKRNPRLEARVEHIFSGHRYKLYVPKEMCMIALSLSGVKAPAREEAFSAEAIAFARRNILQRDVQIEVEMDHKTAGFLGTLWWDGGKINMGVSLIEAGLARLQQGFGDRVTEGHLLAQAQERAKKQKLKIWEKEVEAPPVATTATTAPREPMEVEVVEVLEGGAFYVQSVKEHAKLESIHKQLQEQLTDKPAVGFQPKKNEAVAAEFDGSWYRATVLDTPKQGGMGYKVFYLDYGNEGEVPLSKLRPLEHSLAGQGLAILCGLAHIKIPADFSVEAAQFLSSVTMGKGAIKARVEASEFVQGRGQGTGNRLLVTLTDKDSDQSVNAAMLENGLARLDKSTRAPEVEKLAEYEERARKARVNVWMYGDAEESDDEDRDRKAAPSKRGGRR